MTGFVGLFCGAGAATSNVLAAAIARRFLGELGCTAAQDG